MPRNQGTSRKGKPKKEMRAAGLGKALQRYVLFLVLICELHFVDSAKEVCTFVHYSCILQCIMSEWCTEGCGKIEWGTSTLTFQTLTEEQWCIPSLWFWRSLLMLCSSDVWLICCAFVKYPEVGNATLLLWFANYCKHLQDCIKCVLKRGTHMIGHDEETLMRISLIMWLASQWKYNLWDRQPIILCCVSIDVEICLLMFVIYSIYSFEWI